MEFWELLVTVVVAVGGWYVAHYLSVSRDRANKRLDQRIDYLIESFRTLARIANHPRLYEVNAELRLALANIQLFGNEQQISMVARFVNEMRTKNKADLDVLLAELRTELRKELGLQDVTEPIRWLWVSPAGTQAET